MIANRLCRSVLDKATKRAADGSSNIKVKQHYEYDCGAACLASVAAYYGVKCSLAQIRMLCGCSPNGISIQGMIDGASKLGLMAKGYKSPQKEILALSEIDAPIIAHILDEREFYHFVTIYGIGKKGVRIMNPATGEIENLTIEKFTSQWTGYIIAVTPATTIKREGGKSTHILWSLFPIIKNNRKELLLASAGSIVCTFAGISITFLLQQLIDEIIPAGNYTAMAALGVLAFLLMGLSLYIGYSTTRYLVRSSLKIETALMAQYIDKIFTLPLPFFTNYRAGDISSRTTDIHTIRGFVTEGVIGIVGSIITVAGALVVMALYNPGLTLYITLFIPIYYGLYKFSVNINKKYGREIAKGKAAFESDFLDGISGINGIRHYGAYPVAVGKIEGSLVALMGKLNVAANIVNLFETSVQGVSKLLVCIILTAGSAAVLKGSMSLGELVGFYTLCTFFTAPLNTLINTSNKMASTTVACERIFEILNLNCDPLEEKGIPTKGLANEIQLSGIEFRYPGREELLNGLSFTIPQGKITLIRGKSGCGKSTLARLLLRDYAPNAGNITLGGVNIAQLDLRQWRDMTGYVPQNTHLFNASILENITFKKEDSDIERVLDICTRLNMGEMLQRFPEGLLTGTGKGGNDLSGGECQKIAVARALYKDPQIFIFDEVTSSLDSVSEECILNVMVQLRDAGKTIIFISHKERSKTIADNVVTIN